MASAPEAPIPSEVKLHRVSKTLELAYDESGKRYVLPCEYLRVYSPSAEVRGHAPGQEVLQHGCREVGIERVEPVGNYAVRLVFSDGHDTGLYTCTIWPAIRTNSGSITCSASILPAYRATRSQTARRSNWNAGGTTIPIPALRARHD